MNKIIIITYDISDDKLRTSFSKFLERYGVRIQFSVYEIRNSSRIIDIVTCEVEGRFKPKFTGADSVYIFKANSNETITYGSASDLDNDLIFK